jgi:hypothetical protein
MLVRACRDSDLPSWQDFVDRMPNAGCMHHAGWYGVLRNAYTVTPYFLMAVSDDNEVQGVLPLYHSRSRLTGSHVSSLEDGVLALRPEVAGALFDEALALCQRTGARYLQIRGGSVPRPGTMTQQTVRTFIMTGQPVDSLWAAVKKKTRWAVRQAEQGDIRVEHDRRLVELEAFYYVYAEHMRALGTPVMGIDAFEAIRAHLGLERLRLYLVRSGSKLIGGMLCIVNGNGWTDYYAIVRPSKQTEFANYLLYWHVIREASACKVQRLDLGRSTPSSNVHLFKRKWGGLDFDVPYHFYPVRGAGLRGPGLQHLKKGRGLPQQIWSQLPLALCNRLGPLLRKELPFI